MAPVEAKKAQISGKESKQPDFTEKENDSVATPGFTGFGIRSKLAGAIGSLFGV